jgi:electron transfer flavoprotein beta subunit
MKIVVCVKRVPDTAVKIKIGANGKTIEKGDVEYITSPYDEIAVEHAVQLKEKMGNVELVIVSLGSPETEKNIRTCLAMGADRGILIPSDKDIQDPFVIAQSLAKVAGEEKPDLLLFGIKAVDDDNAQVGPMVATLLGMPFVPSVVEFKATNTTVQAESEVEGGHQVLESPMPVALSIQKGKVEPRICSLISIRKAKNKEIKNIKTELASPCLQIEKMELPPERTGGKIVGEGMQAVPELFRLLREEAKIL